MNRRDAKREACFRAACVIEDAMSSGWPSEQYPDEADYLAVSVGLNELIAELQRRGALPAAQYPTEEEKTR